MMLHHDIAKHLTFLRQSTSDKATATYLDELIGQQQDVSPVVQSRNRTLDILLNAKLGEAAEKGIAVEILQADAPESLPLTDAEPAGQCHPRCQPFGKTVPPSGFAPKGRLLCIRL